MATTSTRDGTRSSSRVTSQRMYSEQTTHPAGLVRRATTRPSGCTCSSRPGSQPWCRPASVAWMVATSGRSRCSLRVTAVCVTSQSWAWMTSYSPVAAARSAARVSVWLNAIVQASRVEVASGNSGGSSGARTTRTPSDVLLQRRAGRVPGDDGDLVAGRHQRGGEGVHVPAQPADHDRWVLPREHQDPHRCRRFADGLVHVAAPTVELSIMTPALLPTRANADTRKSGSRVTRWVGLDSSAGRGLPGRQISFLGCNGQPTIPSDSQGLRDGPRLERAAGRRVRGVAVGRLADRAQTPLATDAPRCRPTTPR